jgi:hypothetical protein
LLAKKGLASKIALCYPLRSVNDTASSISNPPAQAGYAKDIMHKSLTTERIMRAVESNMNDCTNIGFCKVCGEEQEGCERDARKYECESCGAKEVFGAEELLF